MRFTELIGTQADYIEHLVITPQYHPCPQCGIKGKRLSFPFGALGQQRCGFPPERS